ncbi:hypothetical protein ACIRLA_22105 [Streptomyces sp. NPDC102364]|uniref:hypothetical protein n=1 Tax=Streptomyces sp. NPDC102364 TaxID=3366161 RepID=UPI00380A41C4
MKMPHPIEAGGFVTTVTVAGFTAESLTDHGVSVLVVLAVLGSMLSAGMTLTDLIVKAATTEVYRCTAEGCQVEIRATRDHTPERLAVLKDMATDHVQHGSGGV